MNVGDFWAGLPLFFWSNHHQNFLRIPMRAAILLQITAAMPLYFLFSIPTLGGIQLLRAHFPLLSTTEITISHGWPQ
ncbi:MAG: hypothetical protein ACKO8Z_05000 [Prosthecobacter sp.]